MEITAGPWTFRARAAGPAAGTPVLLLHGFPQTSRCWVPTLDALGNAGYRAVAFDQRGYSPGARPADAAAYTPDQIVADTLAVADSLGWDRFHLVGHDFGGAVAWQLAGRHPERLHTLTVASTPHVAAFRASYQQPGDDQHQRSGYIRRFRHDPRGEPEADMLADDAARLRATYDGLDGDAIEEYVAHFAEPGALVAAVDWYRGMSGAYSAETPPSPVPTLYVWSDQDPALGRTAAEATAELVTGPYRFEVLAGVDHWIPEKATSRFVELLLEHLRQHPG